MPAIDASSMIHAWDNYPIEHFPKLWDWLATEVGKHSLYLPNAAFTEVAHKVPDCCTWLRDCDCQVVKESNAILQAAMNIKQLLGIQNDQYHPDGVDENDILIIATAKVNGHALISNESRQTKLPANPKRYKIPAVCGHASVTVACNNFIEYLKASNQVF